MSDDPQIGQRRYTRRVLSPIFPADVEPEADDLLDVEEWDGESWRHVGKITHGELVNRREM